MDVQVRRLTEEESLEVLARLPAYAFVASPPLADKEERQAHLRKWDDLASYALFEDGEAVSCASSAPLRQRIRGKDFHMAGILHVATDPASRHKGYSRQVLQHLFREERMRGKWVSCLYPFRESFYQRLGYVTFPRPKILKITPLDLLPVLDIDLTGTVQMQSIADAYDAYERYVHEMQPGVHGMALFEQDLRPFIIERNAMWVALAKVGEQLEGVMLYQLQGKEVTKFHMRISRFFYRSSHGRYLLLDWIARHADQAASVEILLPATELPETWLPDMGLSIDLQIRAPMGRVLEISQLCGMQVGPGEFTVEVHDSLCPWNQGVWRFMSDQGSLGIEAASDPQGTLEAQGVAAMIYGTHDPQNFHIRGWGELSVDIQERMRRMFPPAMPYLYADF